MAVAVGAVVIATVVVDPDRAVLAEPQRPGGADFPLPADVHPETRNRLPPLSGSSADEPYDAEAIRGRGAGNARWTSPLGRRLTELAILVTGREHDQPYEWTLHELEALAVGLDSSVIDVVRDRRSLDGLGEQEAIVIQLGRELFGAHRLSPATYARAVARLGERNLVDLVDLMARYSGIAVRLTAFNQHMPPDWVQLLPLPFVQPDDIHPDSRSRLPLRQRSGPPPTGARELYSRTLSPEGTGPGHLARHGAGRASLEASVGTPIVGLATLLAARALDSQYAWTMGEVTARRDGLDPAVIDVVRHRQPASGLNEREAALVTFARELFTDRVVTAGTYATAVRVFGARDLVDLVIVMGERAGDIAVLTAFDQQLPPGVAPRLPLP